MLRLWKHKALNTGATALVTRSLPAKVRPISMGMTQMRNSPVGLVALEVVQAFLGSTTIERFH